MKENPKTGRMTISFEELAYTNMIVVEALVQLVTERKMLTRQEIEERIKAVKRDMRVRFRGPS